MSFIKKLKKPVSLVPTEDVLSEAQLQELRACDKAMQDIIADEIRSMKKNEAEDAQK